MHYYLLDKLVCPVCEHFPLEVKVVEECDEVSPALQQSPCELYCGYEQSWRARDGGNTPCAACLERQIVSGELICSKCGSQFPIGEGIPRLVVNEQLDSWVTAEQTWWDQRYRKLEREVKNKSLQRVVAGHRDRERARYLFAPLRQHGVCNSVILEIGAGASQYVARLFSPRQEQYFYIGTDVALEALRVGAELIPEGDFVQCSVERLPFREQSVDTLICLGVLHHLARWQETLDRLIALVRPGGWILFDEAIEKPRVFGGVLKKAFGTRLDSPHGGAVNFQELAEAFAKKGNLLFHKKKMTMLRALLVLLLGKWMEGSGRWSQVVLWLDDAFARSVGRVLTRLGPNEALGIFGEGTTGLSRGDAKGQRPAPCL